MEQSWSKEEIEERLRIFSSNGNYDFEKVKIFEQILSDLRVRDKDKQLYVDKKIFFYLLDKFDLSYFESSFFKMVDYISSRLKKLDLSFYDMSSEYKSSTAVKDMCKSFFKIGEKSNYLWFKKIMLNHLDRFRLYREESLSFSGRTYYLDEDDFYVLINGENSLHEMNIVVHEVKHIENIYKGYNSGVMLYEELPSLLYQLYSIDYLFNYREDFDSVNELLRRHLIKYIKMILNIKEKMDIITKLLTDPNFYSNIHENYNIYYEEYKLAGVFNFLRFGVSDKEIGYILSFLASAEIYLNSERRDSENALSGYLFGLYKIKPHMLDQCIDYFETILGVKNDYEKNQYKILI